MLSKCVSVYSVVHLLLRTQGFPVESEYAEILIVFPICVYKAWGTILHAVQGLKTFSGHDPRLLQACFSFHFLQLLRENWIITVG